MATLEELAGIRRRRPYTPPGAAPLETIAPAAPAIPAANSNIALPGQTLSSSPVIGASGIKVGPINVPGVPATNIPVPVAPPPGDPALANDVGVNSAYQALMSQITQGDQDKAAYQRQLATNLQNSQNSRVRGLLNAHQSMSDRGLFNSGIALGNDANVNQQYDTYDFGLSDAFQNQLQGIDRTTLGLGNVYDNSKVIASGNYAAAQAKSAADALAAKAVTDAQNQQIADLIAAMTPPAAPEVIPPTPEDPIWQQAASPPAVYNPKPPSLKAKPKAVASGTTGKLALKKIGGPQ